MILYQRHIAFAAFIAHREVRESALNASVGDELISIGESMKTLEVFMVVRADRKAGGRKISQLRRVAVHSEIVQDYLINEGRVPEYFQNDLDERLEQFVAWNQKLGNKIKGDMK